MSHPKTNRYRSGAKNPHRQVIVSETDEGKFAVTVFDTQNLRIVHEVIGQGLTSDENNDKIETKP